MLREVDIVVLLGLLRHHPGGWTVRSLAQELRLPSASVQRSLDRLAQTPVFDARRRRVSMAACDELFDHALRYLAPVVADGETRGLATSWAAPPLADHLAESGEMPPVWPDPQGALRGFGVKPLHPAVVALARANPSMYELLALTDALRMGDGRTGALAVELLRARIHTSPAAQSA
ncbi:MAG TPA: hypothetical protein VMS02_03750 [Solirubrobacteraceae bacterium]|nr:hypothetical protein [Solirubrobacteraceae bacterium]